jgi:hypothetical protein
MDVALVLFVIPCDDPAPAAATAFTAARSGAGFGAGAGTGRAAELTAKADSLVTTVVDAFQENDQ